MVEDIWGKSLELLKERLNSQAFNTWLRPIRKASVSDGEFIIQVPNKFFEDWIRDNYMELIRHVLKDVSKKEFNISFYVEKEDSSGDGEAKAGSPPKKKAAGKNISLIGLIPKYNFDTFVVGSSNQFSHAASLAVAENPGATYNPLFLYAGAGLGKTHLLNAIGQHMLEKNASSKICYIRAETFMNELINGIRYDKMNNFREKYRHMDLLLVDDVQILAGKERTQEEFFHTFNALYESHKQIVVASDKFPKNIPELDERLRSRFEWGLVADIQPPDTETKVAILRKKADMSGIDLPNDVAFFLASNVHSNVRELEGLFNRLCAFASLNKADITTDFAKEVLKDFLASRDKYLSIEYIQKTVAPYFGISVADLKSRKRKKIIAFPRQIAMYLARELTGESYPEIGHKFGGKDHSTVMHAVSKIGDLIKTDPYTKNIVDALISTLKH